MSEYKNEEILNLTSNIPDVSPGDSLKIKKIIFPEVNDTKVLAELANGTHSLCKFIKKLNKKRSTFPNLEVIDASAIKVLPNKFFKSVQTKTVILNESLKYIPEAAFYDSTIERITIPSSVNKIVLNAFKNTSCLSVVTFEKGAKRVELGLSCFEGSSITNIVNSECIGIVYNNAFINSNISKFVFGDYTTYIGDHAFENCQNLSYVYWPDVYHTIHTRCFYNCKKLKEIKNADSVEIIRASAFAQSGISSLDCFPNLVNIQSNAFRECVNLTNVSFPDKINTICRKAFSNCFNLKTVVWPENIHIIRKRMFYGCRSLQQVIGADSIVFELEAGVFEGTFIELNLNNLKKCPPDFFSGTKGKINLTLSTALVGINEEDIMKIPSNIVLPYYVR